MEFYIIQSKSFLNTCTVCIGLIKAIVDNVKHLALQLSRRHAWSIGPQPTLGAFGNIPITIYRLKFGVGSILTCQLVEDVAVSVRNFLVINQRDWLTLPFVIVRLPLSRELPVLIKAVYEFRCIKRRHCSRALCSLLRDYKKISDTGITFNRRFSIAYNQVSIESAINITLGSICYRRSSCSYGRRSNNRSEHPLKVGFHVSPSLAVQGTARLMSQAPHRRSAVEQISTFINSMAPFFTAILPSLGTHRDKV